MPTDGTAHGSTPACGWCEKAGRPVRWLVSFDIGSARRRRRVCRLLLAHGERVQASVFELELRASQWDRLAAQMRTAMDAKQDHWRAWMLCVDDQRDSSDLGLPSPATAPPLTVV